MLPVAGDVVFHTLVAQKELALEFVHIERSEIEETGEYALEGLFVRLAHRHNMNRQRS